MTFGIFGKKKTAVPEPRPAERVAPATVAAPAGAVSAAPSLLKHFYTSEKASAIAAIGQYVFKVARGATKRAVAEQVEKRYKVSVTGVKMINLPRKRKDIGKYPGFRSGFRKAIVVLAKGQRIEQAGA